jgi:8-oxo-dGTP pyrophosphatase MutT (NUDIX family)
VSNELELEFIQLAVGDGRRKVRTPEGASFYDQPIGTIITADMIKKARAAGKAQGVKPPKGGLSKKVKTPTIATGKASPASNFDATPGAPGKKSPVAAAPSQPRFDIKPPSIKGPSHFKLGDSDFSAPAGSKLIKPKKTPDMAYVVTPDGEVHAFNPAGEIDLDTYQNGALKPVLKKKFEDMKSSDPLYKVENFDTAKTTGLVEQQPGAKLKKNGKTAFVKQANGVWSNPDIGVEMSDEDLQGAFDGGEFDLEPTTTVDEVDFAKMTEDELTAAFEAMPNGKQMKLANAVMTKHSKGWRSSLTGKSLSNEDFALIAVGSSKLTDQIDQPEPESPEPSKKEKAKKDKEAADPLMDPEKTISPDNLQKKRAESNMVTGAEILSMKTGDSVYHPKMGAIYKQNKNQWQDAEGNTWETITIQTSANMNLLSKEPWNEKQAKEKAETDLANKLVVNGKEVSTINRFGENERSEAIKKDGGSTPNVFELEPTPENAKTFRDAMQKSLEGNPYSASVYVYDEEDYAGMRLFLSDDGKSGIALHDGDEIVSVFSDPKSKNKKVARHLISIAVQNGGKRLDAFDTVLPSIYAKEGFVVKSRLKWNDEYPPDGWDKEVFAKFNNGEPDVVFMQHEPGMEDMDYEPGFGDYVEDYDSGLASTGGKAQDEDDYRPESGDPDNENSTVETSPKGWVVSEEVKKALSEGKKISAVKALMNANPDKKPNLMEAKQEIEALISEGIAPGTPFTTGMLWELPKDAKFRTPAGVVFTKNEFGNWVTPNGGVYTPEYMSQSETNGSVVVENPNYREKATAVSEPAEDFAEFEPQNPVPDREEWEEIPENGTPVTSLEGFQPGDSLKVQTPEGTHSFTKNTNGSWHDTLFGVDFGENAIQLDVNEGHAWVEATADEEEAALLDEPMPEGPVKIVDEGKQAEGLPKSAHQQAIDALESHSGFQIAYGLKSLPDDHPLKDKVVLDIVVADAKKAYPDLPPKKALIKHLKVQNGQKDDEPLEDWEMALLGDNNPDLETSQIGTRSPKDTATGITGGAFTKKDIKDAINILENYNGKLFKNELNKQGNPLGKLSPNHIVGFDKDKTVTKQKFIDLLKKKVEAPEKVEAEPTSNASYEPNNYAMDYSDTPVPGKVVAADYDMNALVDAPEGSVVSWLNNAGEYKSWTKNSDGMWYSENGVGKFSDSLFFYNSAMGGKLKWDNQKVVEEAPSGESPEEWEVGDKIPGDVDLNALPMGLKVSYSGDINSAYTKVKNGWEFGGSIYDNGVMAKAFKVTAVDGEHYTVVGLPGKSETEIPAVGEKINFKQIQKLPVKSDILSSSGNVWHKAGPDSWYVIKADGTKNSVTRYPDSSLMAFTEAGNATLKKLGVDSNDETSNTADVTPTKTFTVGEFITDFDAFKALPVGSKVAHWYGFGTKKKGSTYTKTGEDSWDDGQLHDTNFFATITAGRLSYEGHEGDEHVDANGDHAAQIDEADAVLDAAIDAHFKQMKELDKAVSILTPEQRGASGDGFVVVHTENGPKITWGKYGAGGIATIAKDENGVMKVLVGKRGDDDLWYLPGGAIDENETHLQGSLREFSEEIDNGDTLLDNIKITKGYQAVIGKIDGTDKDWKYVTSVAELPNTMDITAPATNDAWELSEYKWFSAEELDALDASGMLHSALSDGKLAEMVGFTQSDSDDLHSEILSLMSEPDNLNEDRYDIANWKKVGGGQGGSNPGGVYEDPLGNKFYVKESNGGETPMHNEVVAGALYKALGVHSNEVFFVTNGEDRLLATPWVENDSTKLPKSFDGGDPEFIKKAQADFAIDAWLDNYDVAGIGPWNLVADENGDPFRIDPGGAMLFRATGAEKSWWSDEPTAIDDMRFGSSNSSAYTYLPKLFGSMTDEDVKESAKKLLDIDEKKIRQIVESSGFDQDTKNALTQTLITRREKILDRFGLLPEKPVTDTYLSKSGHDITPEVANAVLNGQNAKAIQAFKAKYSLTNEEAKAELFDFAMDAMDGKDKIEKYKKPTAPAGFAKGTKVKVKGANVVFDVELSNHEASAGTVNGKFMVYLNEELTDDWASDTLSNYAFTSDGEVFVNQEKVTIPDPANPYVKQLAYVLNADWASGEVNLVVGDKIIPIAKNKISKYKESDLRPIKLPEGWHQPPIGSKGLATFKGTDDSIMHAILHPDNKTFVYTSDDHWVSNSPAFYEQAKANGSGWTEFDPEALSGVADPASPTKVTLPAGYSNMPSGAKPVFKHKYSDNILVEHADDTLWVYSKNGKVGQAYAAFNSYKSSQVWDAYSGEAPTLGEGYAPLEEGWKPYSKSGYNYSNSGYHFVVTDPSGTAWMFKKDGSKSITPYSVEEYGPDNGWDLIGESDLATTPVAEVTPVEVTGPKDAFDNVVAKGDNVTIFKYNKKGLSPKAQIVSINEEKQTARVRRLDEYGVPLQDENGKPLYANVSLSSIRKDNVSALGENGLPQGITMTNADKSSELYGTAEPKPPVAPTIEALDSLVPEEWFTKAEAAYAKYRENKKLPAKSLKASSTAWKVFEPAMRGDASSLETIKEKGYLDDDPALYEELRAAVEAQQAKYADLVSAHEQAVLEYQKKKSDWMAANGTAAYTPLRHEQTLQMNDMVAHSWAKKTFKNIIGKLSSSAKQGLNDQKSSSEWQSLIRKLPAILGMRREDVANAPGVGSNNMKTWDRIKEATEQAGPVGENFRAVRTISFDRLVGPDGTRLDNNADLKQIIGTVQKDHGAMEIVPGSVDHGGKVVDFYPVVMDLAVPASVKGVYTGFNEFSYEEEHGMIMEPGLAMYIWDAEQKPISQLGGTVRWVVKASIIPRDVLPYMNNFEGDPASHNIFIPGKDTTTGIPLGKVVTEVPVPNIPDGMWTLADLENVDIGGKVMDKEGNSWEKTSDIYFLSQKYGYKSPSNVFSDYMNHPGDFVAPAPGKWTVQALDAAPVGFIAKDKTTETAEKQGLGYHKWTKRPDGKWESYAGDIRTAEELVEERMDDVWTEMMTSAPTSLPEAEASTKTVEDIESYPVGTVMDEHAKNDLDFKVTTWTKVSDDNWKASNGGDLSNEELGGFPFKLISVPGTESTAPAETDPWEPAAADAPFNPADAPEHVKYTLGSLDEKSIGTLVTDADGDVWQKTGLDEWKLVYKVSNGYLVVGDTRTGYAVASYM